MHIVYLVKFQDRIRDGIFPNKYIGSKSNCEFINGRIIYGNNKEYFGSPTDKDMIELISNNPNNPNILIECLYKHEDYQNVLNMERDIQLNYDVVASIEYFNKSIATNNNYSDPDYATYRHRIADKVVRLHKNHPKVLTGEYVGCTYGYKHYNDGIIEVHSPTHPGEGFDLGRLAKNKGNGVNNGFYGKTHNQSSIEKSQTTRQKTYKDNPDLYQEVILKLSETASKTFKGKPISETQSDNRKLGGKYKGFIMLKNIQTGKCLKVRKSDIDNYDLEVWLNPFKASKLENPDKNNVQCPHCGKIGYISNMNRWHFDNCKLKGINNESS